MMENRDPDGIGKINFATFQEIVGKRIVQRDH
jgi:hypothetical protein